MRLKCYSACKIDPRTSWSDALPALIRSGWSGDVGRGDGCADSARALRQGQDDPGNCTGPRDVPEHGPQGAAVGGDLVSIRAQRPTTAKAGSMDSCAR